MPERVRERAGAPGRATERATRRTRRAFVRRQWARRWLTWKPVLAVVVLVALLVGGVWLVWFSRLLAVEEVRVTGVDDLRPQQVLGASGVSEGRPLARVDLDDVRARVQAIADVRSASVTREWPHTLVIAVEERDPLAVVDIGGQLRALDEEGVVFDSFRSAPAGLPRVETQPGAGREALQEAASVVAALPEDLATAVDHVEVATVDQLSLVMRDGRTVLWGSADESDLKAQVLSAMVREDPEADVDVTVPGRPSFLP